MYFNGKALFGCIAGSLATVFCAIGGIYLLSKSVEKAERDALLFGLGMYFVGKAFFVGPMLIITALADNSTVSTARHGDSINFTTEQQPRSYEPQHPFN